MIEFLVVGGGIGGAVAAHLLARQGRQVVVLEREVSRRHVIRPEVLWPATVCTLEPMLARLAADEWQLPIRGLRAFDGSRPLFHVDEQTIRLAAVEPRSTDPNVTRAELLSDPDFEIRRGVEIMELLRQHDRATGARVRDLATGAVSELAARWVIGDDGVHSVVRQGCGIELPMRQLPVEIACFEFDWPMRLPAATPHVVLNPNGSSTGLVAMGGIPLPRGRGIGLVAMRFPQSQNVALMQEALKVLDVTDSRLAGLLDGRRFPDEFAHFKPQFGHATSYGMPGAVLLGDAAHPVTPAGGQGANMAIADAVALVDCLGEGDDNLISRYERRRRRANDESISISRSVARAFHLPSWLFNRLIPPLARWFGRRPSRAVRVLRRFSTAFRDATG